MIKSLKRYIKIMKSIARIFPLLAFAGSMLVSCLEAPNPDPSYPSQLFRPINFSGNVDGVDVSFSWAPIKEASYLLEISRDSFLFEQDVKSITIDKQIGYEIGDLRSQTRYSARIKAVSKKSTVKDSEYQTISFVTGLENIFFETDSANIFPTSVEILWESEKTVTHIDIENGSELLKRITLTEGQIAAGSLLVENLDPDKLYTFRIYNNEVLRGSITVLTKNG